MSTLLGYESYQIPLGTSLYDCAEIIKTAITSKGWQVLNDSRKMWIAQPLANSTMSLGVNNESYERAWNMTYMEGDNNRPVSTCATANTSSSWNGVQFVSPVDVRKVWLDIRYMDGDKGAGPAAFNLEWSDNGTDWTILQTWAGITWPEVLVREFVVTNQSAGAHVYWRINCTARYAPTYTSISEIRLFDSEGNCCSPNSVVVLDLIPPAGEPIGDANGFDFCRIHLTTSAISFTPKTKYPNGFKQTIMVHAVTAGNVIPSVTIDGMTVSVAAGLINAGNTGLVNQQLLLDALNTSTEPLIQNWTWSWDAIYGIFGTRKTFGSSVISGTNCTTVYVSRECPPGMISETHALYEDVSQTPMTKTISIDLTSGFVYYLQINRRTLGLSTKTNSGFYGPMFLSYADHAQAVAEMPANSLFCTPIELFLVHGPEGPTHHQTSQTYLVPAKLRGRRQWIADRHPMPWEYFNYCDSMHIATYCRGHLGMEVDGRVHYSWPRLIDTAAGHGNDGNLCPFGNYGYLYYPLASRGSLHTLNFRGGFLKNSEATIWSAAYVPPFSLPDVKRHITDHAVTNENALMSPDTSVGTTLVSQILYTDTPTTIDVVDASCLPASGAVSIFGELFKFTSRSGNTLLGVTRAQYSTTARTIPAGSVVNPVAWFIKINDFALAAGYTRP